MKRRAIVIEASNVQQLGVLPGAVADATEMADWLQTGPGGQWYPHEIRLLRNPTILQVRNEVGGSVLSDYAFITFSGHGFHAMELDQTKLCLSDGDILVRDCIPRIPRSMMVVDACRRLTREVIIEAEGTFSKRASAAPVIPLFRERFDVAVMSAEAGTSIVYSCGINEAAGESARGGFFTRCLLETGAAFAERVSQTWRVLPMNEAFRLAANCTNNRNFSQNPVAELGRRLGHFPFAV